MQVSMVKNTGRDGVYV